MRQYKTISEYKAQAREQLLGNYGMAVSSFVVIFATIYILSSVLMGAYSAYNPRMLPLQGDSGATGSWVFSLQAEIAATVMDLVVGAFMALLTVGFLRILMGFAEGKRLQASELFYGFKNHPDKVLLMYFMVALVKVIALIPARVAEYVPAHGGNSAMQQLTYMALYIVGYAVYFYVYIIYAFRYLIYIDDPGMDIADYFKISRRLMNKNEMRFAGMILSLVGYFILGILSLGIGFAWIVPYKNMITINFYYDAIKVTNDDLHETVTM